MTGVQTCALPICFPVTIRVGKDLSELLQVKVDVHVASPEEYNNKHGVRYFDDYYVMENMSNLDQEVVFDKYTEDPSLIKVSHINRDATVLKLASSLLRSNCKITNQADAGDVFIYVKSVKSPIVSSIIQSLVNHFTTDCMML